LPVRGARPVPEEGLVGLERLATSTAEAGRCLCKVEQMREYVQREMSGAEVQHKLSGHHLLIWRPALGEPLYRRLDAPQTPDVGERPGNYVALDVVELARRRGSWRADRRGCGRMPAAVAAANPRYGTGEREAPDAGTRNGHILTEPNRVVCWSVSGTSWPDGVNRGCAFSRAQMLVP
jgi:hypothetical protein